MLVFLELFMKTHEKIQVLRKAKGLTQDDLAEQLNMSKNGYANIEQNNTKLTIDRLVQISAVLGIEPKQLLDNGSDVFHFFTDIQNNTHNHYSNGVDEQRLQNLEKEVYYLKQMIEQKDVTISALMSENKALKELLEK